MVSLRIGTHERQGIESLEESWVSNVIQGYKRNDEKCCVVLKIDEEDVDLKLATSDCGLGGGGTRKFTSKEQDIIDLWTKLDLNSQSCNPGNLIAFLKQLQRIIQD